MKLTVIISGTMVLSVIGSGFLHGQISNDHDAVLNLSLQMSENHVDMHGNNVLAIVDNDKVVKTTGLTLFESKVFFAQESEIRWLVAGNKTTIISGILNN